MGLSPQGKNKMARVINGMLVSDCPPIPVYIEGTQNGISRIIHETLCDSQGTRFTRVYIVDSDGTGIERFFDVLSDGTSFSPVGDVGDCDCERNQIAETCYQSNETVCQFDDLDRVIWQDAQSWDSSNPDQDQIESALSGGDPVTTENTQQTGIQSTISIVDATGLDRVEVGSDFLRAVILPSGTIAIRHDVDSPSCLKVSTRIHNPTEIASDGVITAVHNTSDPAIQGGAPVITGNGTGNVSIDSPTDDSRVLLTIENATYVQYTVDNDWIDESVFNFGTYIGSPVNSGGTYKAIWYDCGDPTIFNVNDPSDRPQKIDPSWSEIECCKPMIASYKGDQIPAIVPQYNIFSVYKPQCCTVTVTTSAGEIIIPDSVVAFTAEKFDCPLSEFSVSGDCLSNVTVFLQNTGV